MKFNFEKREKRLHKRSLDLVKWHRWFAWCPVQVSTYEWVWLEFAERRRVNDWFGGYWEYRARG